MSAAEKIAEEVGGSEALSSEMVEFIDHLAGILAEEFAAALAEGSDESGGVREVFEREPAGTEHRGSDPGLQAVR